MSVYLQYRSKGIEKEIEFRKCSIIYPDFSAHKFHAICYYFDLYVHLSKFEWLLIRSFVFKNLMECSTKSVLRLLTDFSHSSYANKILVQIFFVQQEWKHYFTTWLLLLPSGFSIFRGVNSGNLIVFAIAKWHVIWRCVWSIIYNIFWTYHHWVEFCRKRVGNWVRSLKWFNIHI